MCNHNRIIGDNYGETCQDCGQILSGYGYGGWFGKNLIDVKECKHKFLPYDNQEICIYCQRVKE